MKNFYDGDEHVIESDEGKLLTNGDYTVYMVYLEHESDIDLWWEIDAPEEPEITIYTEEQLTSMTNAELQDILASMDISATMNKANMVRLILGVQNQNQ